MHEIERFPNTRKSEIMTPTDAVGIIEITPIEPKWREQANCAPSKRAPGKAIEQYYPGEIINLCATCPVTDICLSDMVTSFLKTPESVNRYLLDAKKSLSATQQAGDTIPEPKDQAAPVDYTEEMPPIGGFLPPDVNIIIQALYNKFR